jgi:hypothetical protein
MQELGELLEECPAARPTVSCAMCANTGTFPHHSRAILELPNPFHGEELSRLRQALSICRMIRIAMIIGQFLARLCRRRSNNARPARSETGFDKPKAP